MSGRDRWDDEDQPLGRERVRRSGGPSRPSEASRSQTSILANPNAMKREAHEPDYIILVAVLALSAIGILMVYSASAIPSYARSQNTFQLVAPQVLAGLLGLAAMVILMRIDYRYLRVASVPLAVLALVMLLIVLVPLPGPLKGMVVSANGSARWLHLGPFLPDIHPAEVAKLALVVYLSHWLATRGNGIRSFWNGSVPFAIIVIPFLILVVREPDLGTASVLVFIVFSLYFVAGARLFHLVLAVLAGIGGGALVVAMGSYPLQRIQTLIDPWADPQNTGYQTVKGLEALSAGGLFGTGLGNDRIFVPQDVNDFIFSVIAEESGFVGSVIVLTLYGVVLFCGIRIAGQARDRLGKMMAVGVVALLFSHVFINIGMNIRIMPVTGVPLPLLSYGGSSVLGSLIAMGILQNVYTYRKAY